MSNHLYDALFLPHRDRDAPFLTLADEVGALCMSKSA